MSERKRESPIPERFLPDVGAGTVEFIKRGYGDSRWGFSVDYLGDGDYKGLWIIGWRGSSGFPMFLVNPEWSFMDYVKAVDKFLKSPGWTQMAWVATRTHIIDEFQVEW